MLYETLNQPYLVVIFIITGLVGGLIFDLLNFIKFLCNNKKFACILFDVLATSLCLGMIFVSNITFNYGQIRIFPFILFTLSFTIERFTLGKLFAKIYTKCYNLIIKLRKFIWGKIINGKTNKTN